MKLFLFTIFIVIFTKINVNEELVVQLKSSQDLPLLQEYLFENGFSSVNIVSYFDGKITTPTTEQLSRHFLLEIIIEDEPKEILRNDLLKLPFVSASFIKPEFVNAEFVDKERKIQIQDSKQNPTKNYIPRQVYREKAPRGVGIDEVRSINGSTGSGITVFDIEQGFNFQHEDLIQHNGRVIVGKPIEGSIHHGAAVCGVISGRNIYLLTQRVQQ